MNGSALSTLFAPAERAGREELDRQVQYFSSIPLQCEVLDAIPGIVVVLNTHRQIIFANRALKTLVEELGESSPIGKRPGEALHCVHAFESAGGCGTTEFCRTCGAVQAIMISQKGKAYVQECLISREAQLDSLDLSVAASPLMIDHEMFTVFAVSDISHEKRRRALERIFFHDVLNIAGGLSGYLDLLALGEQAEREEYRSILELLTKKLIDEINAQRMLTAAETHEMIAVPIALQSLDVIQEQCNLFRYHTVAKNRTLHIDPKAQQYTFVSDPMICGRVLGNMIKNALEASPETGTVTIGCSKTNEQVEFWVHNTTVIPRHVQLQMFLRSFSTKGLNRGLGTYSMKLLCERYLLGKVSFTTSTEEGTIFRMLLPELLIIDKAAMSKYS